METTTYNHHHVDTIHELGWNKTEIIVLIELKTKILDGAFIGSNTSLIAPIKIRKKSVVGAGSALSNNVKDKSLSLTRSKQIEIKNYKRK